jgi:hypothetical protein
MPILETPILRDWIAIARDIVIAVVACVGLRSWRREMKGRKRFEVATRLLHAAVVLRETIAFVRNPSLEATESREAEGKEGDESSRRQLDYQANASSVYEKRWTRATGAWTDFSSALLEAEILFGLIPRETGAELWRCFSELKINLMIHLDPRQPFRGNVTRTDEVLSVIWAPRDDSIPDPFGERVAAAVSTLKLKLTEYIK